MTEQNEAAEVEVLAEIIWGILPSGTSRMGMENAAREVLASDWLTAREAAAEARGAERALREAAEGLLAVTAEDDGAEMAAFAAGVLIEVADRARAAARGAEGGA